MLRRKAAGIAWLVVLAAGCGASSRAGSEGTAGAGGTDGAGVGATGGDSPSGATGGTLSGFTGGTTSGSSGSAIGGSTSGSAGSGTATGGSAGSGTGGTGGAGAAPETDFGDTLVTPDGHCALRPMKPGTAPSEVRFNGVTIRSDQHDCEYELGESVALPVAAGDGARLLFHYDLNGDGIDDLFLGQSLYEAAGSQAVTLLVSKLDGLELSFERVDCGLDWALDDFGYYLRHLNGDALPDLVVNTHNGVRVLLNTADGPRVVVDYEFPHMFESWASILDVASGDFDGNGTLDLAVGFDRAVDGLDVETGVLVFDGLPGGAGFAEPAKLSAGPWQIGTVGIPRDLGYLTGLGGGDAFFGVTSDKSSGMGFIYGQEDSSSVFVPTDLSGPTFVVPYASGSRHGVLVGLDTGVVAFDPRDPAAFVSSADTAFEHRMDHEFGGGPRRRGYFLLDLDGDGDDDLVEFDHGGEDRPPAFAFHRGQSGGGKDEGGAGLPLFGEAAPTVVSAASYLAPYVELPFLAVGAMKGRLVVMESDDGPGPLHVVPLACKD